MYAEIAPFVEMNRCGVGRQNVKVDHLTVALFTRRKV